MCGGEIIPGDFQLMAGYSAGPGSHLSSTGDVAVAPHTGAHLAGGAGRLAGASDVGGTARSVGHRWLASAAGTAGRMANWPVGLLWRVSVDGW